VIDHNERIKGVVKTALKQKAMGEPFGFVVAPPSVWPFMDQMGNQVGQGPAWFLVVSIRSDAVGEPDIWTGFPVPGILPADEDFTRVATGLLENCLQQREVKKQAILQAVGVGPSMKLSEKPQ
jgi:hypothetical protein